MVDEIHGVLQNWRRSAEEEFHSIFEESHRLCSTADVEMSLPRIGKCQTKCANYNTTSAKQYYRIAIFVPYMDHLIAEIDKRFQALPGTAAELQQLIPIFIDAKAIELPNALAVYDEDLDEPSIVSEDRLSNMAIMSIHRESAGLLQVDEIINELATRPRRLNFSLL